MMRDARNLEQTPSLVDADVADDVGSMGAAVSVGTSGRGLDAPGCKPCGCGGTPKFSTVVRLNTVGSSRPMVADTPLPNCAVYWMLFTPVT